MVDLRIQTYRVRRDITSLAACGGRLPPGDILLSGRVLILHCPACQSLQFAARTVSGHDAAPNVLQPVQCGAGFCRKCGVWFRILTGRPEIVPAPMSVAVPVSDALRASGVRPPPKLGVE